MNVFHIGDPVLIVDGIEPAHRELIGHMTTVTSELFPGVLHVTTGDRWDIHFVEETIQKGNGIGPCYRPQDLMPLGWSKELQAEERTEFFEELRGVLIKQ